MNFDSTWSIIKILLFGIIKNKVIKMNNGICIFIVVGFVCFVFVVMFFVIFLVF